MPATSSYTLRATSGSGIRLLTFHLHKLYTTRRYNHSHVAKLFLLFLPLAMGHFTDLTSTSEHTGVCYTSSYEIFFNTGLTHENEAKLFCEKKCLEAKYFCKSFILSHKKEFPYNCEIYGKPISQLSIKSWEKTGSLNIFQLSESEQVEPVEERFSHDHHPESHWISDLEKGYGLSDPFGLSKGFLENLIKACTSAMKSEQSTALARNINRKTVPDLVAFSGHKILESVKSLSEYFATVVFIFLDIFCPHINPDIKTIYDPIKNQLSIRGPNIDMLVVSFGLRDYVIVRDALNNPEEPLKVAVSSELRRNSLLGVGIDDLDPDDDFDVDSVDVDYEDHNIVALFQQAMETKIQEVEVEYDHLLQTHAPSDIIGQVTAIDVLNYVLHALLEPNRLSGDYPVQIDGVKIIFYQDLVTAVLSKVYAHAGIAMVRSNLHLKIKAKQYDDLSIIPHH